MNDDIFESLKTFVPDIDILPIPWGGGMPGKANHMYGMRGDLSPARYWLRDVAPPEYFERRNKSVKESWVSADERRKTHSETMKEKWASGKLTADSARKNGNHGLSGKDIHNTKHIEYKGKIYYGWRQLNEDTGVTKHLYNKYYVNGIDPEPRIGMDGPMKGTP
jgi:hypothetical protein